MVVNKFIRDPLWATLVGALVAAMVVSFFVFVQSGEAAPQTADEQTPYASVSPKSPMVVGGTAVPNGKYPFMAYVTLYRNAKPDASCGGSLIDRNSVLTAAHCLINTTGAVVVVGRTDLRKNRGQEIGASRPFIHPRYLGSGYDVGVLKLRRPVKGIKPIKLATAKQNNLETPGRKLTVAGWGLTAFNGTPPNRLRQAQVPVVSDRRAESSYDAVVGPSGYEPPLMIAAGNSSKVNACVGDSGGPLFDSGSRTQVGIVSGGRYKCGTARYPGKYTEVNNPNIRNFILTAAKR